MRRAAKVDGNHERLSRLARALAIVTTTPCVTSASAPLKLRNPLNGSGLSTSRGARMASNTRRQKERLVGRTLGHRINPWDGNLPKHAFAVVLTRISPRPFDDDNNAAALKSVRDGIAEAWCLNDADPRVTWVTDWRKGKDSVEASLWLVPVETPKRGLALLLGAIPMPSDVECDASDYERPDSWILEAAQKTGAPEVVEPTKLRKAGL